MNIYSMEQRSREEIPPLFMKPDNSLPSSQQPTIGPYSDLDEHLQRPHTPSSSSLTSPSPPRRPGL
jgi:hypothetical protein